MVTFEGKVVFVTGGATGIGAGIVARSGPGRRCRLLLQQEPGQRRGPGGPVEGELGREVFPVQADLTDPAQIKRAIETTVTHFGRPVTILVNNAGDNINPTPVETMPLELWQKVLSINLTGPFLCAQQCIPGMKAAGGGRIINVTSISARTGGGPGGAHYVASKAGLEGFTRALAKELAPFNITVNGVAPGVVTRQSTSAPTRRRAWSGCARPSRCCASARSMKWREWSPSWPRLTLRS